jgi:hypothetical protein
MGPLPNGFPAAERNPKSIQVRVTSSGLDFLEAHVSEVAEGAIPGGLSSDVPPECTKNPKICCPGNGQAPKKCRIIVDLEPRDGDPPRLELTPQDPPGNRLGVLVRTRIRTETPMPIEYNTGIYPVKCDVTIDSERAGKPSLTMTTALDFLQDRSAGTTRLVSGPVEITDLDNDDLELKGGIDCAIANLAKGVFMGQFKKQIEDQVKNAITEQLCKTCETDGTCAPFASCQEQTCEIDDSFGKRCLQELGATGRMAAASVFASISPGMTGNMDLYDVAGGYATTTQEGLSLGVLGGALPAEHHPCVPSSSAPPKVDVPLSAFFQGNTRPDTNAAFDVGLGVHISYLNQALWAAYEAGFLCLSVGPAASPMLNTDTFAIVSTSLSYLLDEGSVPLILGLRPQVPATMTLGDGTFQENDKGETVIDDPLFTISLPKLEIDVYALIDQRYVRVFTVHADVTLPLSLDVSADGKLLPVLGDVEEAFTNLAVTNSELLTEEPEELATNFRAILGVAVPMLTSQLGGIDLPDLVGLKLEVQRGGITSVDDHTFFALFANLAAKSETAGKPTRAVTRARIMDVRAPAPSAFAQSPRDPDLRPEIDLELGGDGAAPLEFQYRIDGGFWSPFGTRSRVTLVRDAFWRKGRHTVEVRAREVGRPDTLDPRPVLLEAQIDPGPTADEYENVLGPERQLLAFHGRAPAQSGGCGCAVGGHEGATTPLALLLLGLLPWVWFKFRRVAALLLTLVGLSCGGELAGQGHSDLKPVVPGTIGRYSDLAASKGRVVVSAYEQSLGDLVVSDVGKNGELSFRTVDGVPDEPPELNPYEYRGGIRGKGANVGAWTSIALFDGKARVSYQDRDAGALKYAYERKKGGVFAYHAVDVGPGVAGLYTSLSLSKTGVPGVAYMATGIDDGKGGKKSQLRWAQAKNATPAAQADWTVTVVAEAGIPCAGLCKTSEVCVKATAVCQVPETTCGDTCAGDTACVGGMCTDILPSPSFTDLPEGTGLFASAGRLPDDRPVIAFHDRSTGDLRLAVLEAAGTWSVVPLDATPEADTGQWASLVVAKDGTVHVAYQDATTDRLLVVSWKDGQVGAIQVVDDGLRPPERPHPVGASAQLMLLGDGSLRVAYQDSALSDLLLATRSQDGTWTRIELSAGPDGYGFYAAAAVEASNVWVSNFVYSTTIYPPGQLEVGKAP